MQLGVDYSFAKMSGATIKNGGYQFACRYLASSTAKRISSAEVADLQANQVAISLVFEDYADPLKNHPTFSAFNAGVADAQLAVAQAGSIGWPSYLPIYFAVDFDIPDYAPASNDPKAKLGPYGDYFAGVGSVLGVGRVGGYGGFYLIKRLFDAGLATYGWQTIAWSAGQVDGRIHLYQNGNSAFNGNCDIDEARQANFGQWGDSMTKDQAAQLALYLRLAAGESVQQANDNSDYDVNHILADPAYAGGLAKQIYQGNELFRYKGGHYDADVAAAYEKGKADGTTTTGGGLTADQAAALTRIDTAVKWIQDKLGGIFK